MLKKIKTKFVKSYAKYLKLNLAYVVMNVVVKRRTK
jgi:hypothetical protein